MNMHIVCSVYLRNSKYGPSCYYRIMQYLEELNTDIDFRINDALSEKDFINKMNLPGSSCKKFDQVIYFVKICFRRTISLLCDIVNKPDVVIVQREVFPRFLPITIRLLMKLAFKRTKLIWDFDDDIFTSREISKRETNFLCKNSIIIVGIGDYAKSLIPKEFQSKFLKMHTTDKSFSNYDLLSLSEIRKKIYVNCIKLVWVGTISNIGYLDTVIKELDDAAKQLNENYNKRLELVIVCNVKYECRYECRFLIIKNIKWSRNRANNAIKNAHIGIMPLSENRFEKGKGGFKLIQYMAAGIPVIASKVGFNSNVVSDDCGFLISLDKQEEWTDRIDFLSRDVEIWNAYCLSAQERYLNKFDYRQNLAKWKEMIWKG